MASRMDRQLIWTPRRGDRVTVPSEDGAEKGTVTSIQKKPREGWVLGVHLDNGGTVHVDADAADFTGECVIV